MLDHRPFRIDLTVPSTSKRVRPPGIFLRRRDLDPVDRQIVRGLSVTGPTLTVLETAPTVHRSAQFLDRALQKHVGFDELYDAYTRSTGARGMAAAGEWVHPFRSLSVPHRHGVLWTRPGRIPPRRAEGE